MKTQSKIFVSSVFLFASMAIAGTIKSSGTAGASQLLIPVGAQNIALGAANTATASGVEALFSNPAGIGAAKGGFQGTVSQMDYIADVNVFFSGFVANLGNGGSFGLSIKTLDFGDIPVTTADNTEGTGENYSPSFSTITAAYSKSFFDRVRFGTSLKLVSEQIINTGANGVAVDMGVQYQFADQPIAIGVVLRNLGSRLEYQGSDLEQTLTPEGSQSGSSSERFRVKAEAFDLPATLSIGVNYKPMPGLSLMGAFDNNSFSVNTVSFAGKYTMGPAWVAGGMSTQNMTDDQPGTATDSQWTNWTESIWGPTFGAGLNVPLGDMNMGIAYSMRTVNSYFSNSSVLQVTIGF
ncbi:MAG: PorV/PorQ family protein [Candidatus Marinimicrobia bacterium]|jgi:hypothetical protein|nr:PorV/PorQ family protein [Candidatus Neomarinimicrobiota bacterium]MBT3617759.1 PorV/PorQ family protein [Candidatus Neomarinimicrobiota bacterium]MBT3828366.1 PorV/PorQ family protein [Candidatus Neomarinimicrobiota bacterium]MBT3997580.1 PorV/PorQ family protein [Candidatus Neomarinimicrobiota bacterium]MBT4280741.1 PorV/PorQ family protein [Candidatus Neomarinimicrobiota bacterium]